MRIVLGTRLKFNSGTYCLFQFIMNIIDPSMYMYMCTTWPAHVKYHAKMCCIMYMSCVVGMWMMSSMTTQ